MTRWTTNFCDEAWNMPLSSSWLTVINLVTTFALFAFAVYIARVFRRKLGRTVDLENRMERVVKSMEASARMAKFRQKKAGLLVVRLEAVVNEAYKVLELATKTQEHAKHVREDVVDQVRDVKKTVEKATEVVVATVSPPAGSGSGSWKKGDVDRRLPEAPSQETP